MTGLFFHILGFLSSQLTFILFKWVETTNQILEQQLGKNRKLQSSMDGYISLFLFLMDRATFHISGCGEKPLANRKFHCCSLPGTLPGLSCQARDNSRAITSIFMMEWATINTCGRNDQFLIRASLFVVGWWFGTFFIFPYIGNSNPFRGVEIPNEIFMLFHGV